MSDDIDGIEALFEGRAPVVRPIKQEYVSRLRYHDEVKRTNPDALDAELAA